LSFSAIRQRHETIPSTGNIFQLTRPSLEQLVLEAIHVELLRLETHPHKPRAVPLLPVNLPILVLAGVPEHRSEVGRGESLVDGLGLGLVRRVELAVEV
jgi:hypothetical protein